MNAIASSVGVGGATGASASSAASLAPVRDGFAAAIKEAHAQFVPVLTDRQGAVQRATVACATPQEMPKVSRNEVKPELSEATGEFKAKVQSKPGGVEEGPREEEETSYAARMLDDGAKNARPDVKPPSEQFQTQPELESRQELQLQAETSGVLPQDKNVAASRASGTTAETHAKEAVCSAAGAKNGAKQEAKKPGASGEVSVLGSTGSAQSAVGYAVPVPQAVMPVVQMSKSGMKKTAAATTSAIAQVPSQKTSAENATVKQETVDPQNDEKVETVSAASSHASEHTAASHGEKTEALPVGGNAVESAARGVAPIAVSTPPAVSASAVVENVRPGATAHLNAAAGSGSASTVSASGELTLRSYEAATPRRLEVGLRGGSFGWLNVRAEMGADGGVQATLRGSVEAAGALRSQAGQLQSFLAGQSVQVNHVSIEAGPATHGWAQHGSDGGAQPQQQRQHRPQADASESDAGATVTAEDSSALDGVNGNLGAGAGSGTAIASTGGWLSVRA